MAYNYKLPVYVIVAYDRFQEENNILSDTPDKDVLIEGKTEMSSSLFRQVLKTIIDCLHSRKWLMERHFQFKYKLNTTIEAQIPDHASIEEVRQLVAELVVKLEKIVCIRVGFGEEFQGNGSKYIKQTAFYELIGNIKSDL